MPSTARVPPLNSRTSPSTVIPSWDMAGYVTILMVEVANLFFEQLPSWATTHGEPGHQLPRCRGLGAHASPVRPAPQAVHVARLGVRPVAAAARRAEGTRPGAPARHERARCDPGLRQLQCDRHRRPA